MSKTLDIPSSFDLVMIGYKCKYNFLFVYGSGILIPPNQFQYIDSRRFTQALEEAIGLYELLASITDYFWAGNPADSDAAKDFYISLANRNATSKFSFRLGFEPLEDIYHSWCHGGAIPREYRSDIESIKELPYRNTVYGYIYLLRAVTPDNHYKIGMSKEPIIRIAKLEVKLPFPIEPVHQFPTDDMYGTEKALHERYADKRVSGEWFELSPQDVAEICAIIEVQS